MQATVKILGKGLTIYSGIIAIVFVVILIYYFIKLKEHNKNNNL